MFVNGENLNLKQYMMLNNKIDKEDTFYSETFAHIVLDYIGSTGEFLEDDIKFLEDNGYNVHDFLDEEENE